MRHTHPAAPPVAPAPAAATQPGNRGIDTTMLCGILETMSPPAAQKPYDKLIALLTTGDGAYWFVHGRCCPPHGVSV